MSCAVRSAVTLQLIAEAIRIHHHMGLWCTDRQNNGHCRNMLHVLEENNISSQKYLKFAKLCSSLQLQAVLQCCTSTHFNNCRKSN